MTATLDVTAPAPNAMALGDADGLITPTTDELAITFSEAARGLIRLLDLDWHRRPDPRRRRHRGHGHGERHERIGRRSRARAAPCTLASSTPEATTSRRRRRSPATSPGPSRGSRGLHRRVRDDPPRGSGNRSTRRGCPGCRHRDLRTARLDRRRSGQPRDRHSVCSHDGALLMKRGTLWRRPPSTAGVRNEPKHGSRSDLRRVRSRAAPSGSAGAADEGRWSRFCAWRSTPARTASAVCSPPAPWAWCSSAGIAGFSK